jgi:hypothetical protein
VLKSSALRTSIGGFNAFYENDSALQIVGIGYAKDVI